MLVDAVNGINPFLKTIMRRLYYKPSKKRKGVYMKSMLVVFQRQLLIRSSPTTPLAESSFQSVALHRETDYLLQLVAEFKRRRYEASLR